jgi:hypothetical protein
MGAGMIERKDILSLEFLKKDVYTGSYQGMRYRLSMGCEEEQQVLQAVVWPEPYNYFHTEEKIKARCYFPFTEEGINQAIDWMNEEWETQRSVR